MRDAVIRIHPSAPRKPALGADCNGCGVCCLSQPFPIGIVVSRRLQGACAALRWDDRERRYRCSLMDSGRPVVARLAKRWIAAGRGCDSSVEVSPA